MIATIEPPVLEVFERWRKAVEPIVGKGNCSMENSQTLAEGKKKYAQLLMTGNSTFSSSLEGHECCTLLSFQVEIYTSGAKAQSEVYKIDNVSHAAMKSMGFDRINGPASRPNIDERLKRYISTYQRKYTGQLLEA